MQILLWVTQVHCGASTYVCAEEGENCSESYYSPLLPFDHILLPLWRESNAIHLLQNTAEGGKQAIQRCFDIFPFITPNVAFLVFGLLAHKDDEKEKQSSKKTQPLILNNKITQSIIYAPNVQLWISNALLKSARVQYIFSPCLKLVPTI